MATMRCCRWFMSVRVRWLAPVIASSIDQLEMRAPRPFIRSTNPGKLVSMVSAPVTSIGSLESKSEDQKAHGDAVVHAQHRWCSRLAAGRCIPRRSGCPRPSSTVTPAALSPSAISSRRSLSLTRSSARPVIRVLPCGHRRRRPPGSGIHRSSRGLAPAARRSPLTAACRRLRSRRRRFAGGELAITLLNSISPISSRR